MKATRQANRRRGGFTLIELMVAVALIGILAAMAITSFQLYQLRSKRSEAKVNLAALRTAQLAYFHEAGGFIFANSSPGLACCPTNYKANWKLGGGLFPVDPPGSGFHSLGWEPEGPTYFDYDTNTLVGSGAFTAAAYGDTDGDGFVSVFLYVHPDSAGVTLPNLTGPPFFNFPFDATTCDPNLSTVAQVPAASACGFPLADDY